MWFVMTWGVVGQAGRGPGTGTLQRTGRVGGGGTAAAVAVAVCSGACSDCALRHGSQAPARRLGGVGVGRRGVGGMQNPFCKEWAPGCWPVLAPCLGALPSAFATAFTCCVHTAQRSSSIMAGCWMSARLGCPQGCHVHLGPCACSPPPCLVHAPPAPIPAGGRAGRPPLRPACLGGAGRGCYMMISQHGLCMQPRGRQLAAALCLERGLADDVTLRLAGWILKPAKGEDSCPPPPVAMLLRGSSTLLPHAPVHVVRHYCCHTTTPTTRQATRINQEAPADPHDHPHA